MAEMGGEVANQSDSQFGENPGPYDIERLTLAVRALADRCDDLVRENQVLSGEARQRRQRMSQLEEQLLAQNQKRQDVRKRIDDLVARLEWLDAHLERGDKEHRRVEPPT